MAHVRRSPARLLVAVFAAGISFAFAGTALASTGAAAQRIPGPLAPRPSLPGPPTGLAYDPGRPGPALTVTAPTGPAPTGPGTTGPGPTRPGPTRPGPTRPGPTRPGPTGPEPTRPPAPTIDPTETAPAPSGRGGAAPPASTSPTVTTPHWASPPNRVSQSSSPLPGVGAADRWSDRTPAVSSNEPLEQSLPAAAVSRSDLPDFWEPLRVVAWPLVVGGIIALVVSLGGLVSVALRRRQW
jgi:hypothetical protein